LSDIKPSHITATQLIEHRKEIEKLDIGKKKAERDAKVAHLQKVQFKDYY
jgi:hypothetical protein